MMAIRKANHCFHQASLYILEVVRRPAGNAISRQAADFFRAAARENDCTCSTIVTHTFHQVVAESKLPFISTENPDTRSLLKLHTAGNQPGSSDQGTIEPPLTRSGLSTTLITATLAVTLNLMLSVSTILPRPAADLIA